MTSQDKGESPPHATGASGPADSGQASVDGMDVEETQTFIPSATDDCETDDEAVVPRTLGRYEVGELLGRGRFGAVYLGFDPTLDRKVAIKVPLISANVQQVEAAFLNEARRLAQLRHHGIVAIHDVGVEQGCCYIVSEYLQGQGLYTWLKTTRPAWQQVVPIVAAIADALAHAHAQSTIHRDVKPGNIILLEEAGGLVPKLLDFGLSISESQAASDQRGLIIGTPAYMSPEQARGLAHRIDGRTDIYSLGVVLYMMLCGQRPFRADSVDELLRQIREDSPQPPRQLAHGIPSELEDICLKAMSKKESDRYKTAGDMAAALRDLLQDSSGSAATAAPVLAPQNLTSNGDSQSGANSSIRRARDAERRRLTVMICNCDARNPERSLASLDPEDQRDVLEEFQRLCEDVINRFGGTIVQSTGQELLVCFGFPTAHEDAPHRAIRTALEIMDEMQHLNQVLQRKKTIQLSPWMAIHTGMVIAGGSGLRENDDTISIVGDARNVISRMEAFTEPEQIIISDATYRLVRGFFVCETRGTHKIKGISQPVELFEVLEESEVHSRIELVDPANLSPLVGRDMEVGIVKDRWEHAEEGAGQVVLLIGDAGLGKSRLVREIKEYVGERNIERPPPVIEWRCSAYHTGTTLFPATAFFERLLGFVRSDSSLDRLDKLVHHLHELHLDRPEQVAMFASLLSIPPDERCAPIRLSPVRQKERTQPC